MKLATTLLAAMSMSLSLLLRGATAAKPQVGDEVCIEGHVMDFFCIARGNLFDNPNVPTLSAQGPLVHSVHCLIDVPQCIVTPFEILLPAAAEDESDDPFIRGWRLDDATKDAVVALAKQEGQCTDCDGNGTIDKGFHVSLTARVVDVGTADTPPTITLVSSLAVSNPGDLQCEGGSARPAPFVAVADPVDANANAEVVALTDGLDLKITDNGNDSATYVMTYAGEAWVALAVSPNGQMVGAQAVIGLPDDNGGAVQIYNLNSRSAAGVVVADADTQAILQDASVIQQGGTTVLTFTVPLERDGFRVSASDETGYLYAYGSSNTLGYHASRQSFALALDGTQGQGQGQAQGGMDIADVDIESDFPQVGDEVCIEGHVMDFFCIGRGTLFDNPSIETLGSQGALVHSVHCLIDVPQCIATPFEILLPNEEGDDFVRGWRLDDATKDAVVALAKAEGQCTDCENKDGAITKGFHVSLMARIVDLGTADTPPTIALVENTLSVSTPETLQCDGGSARPAPFVDTGKDDNKGNDNNNGLTQLEEGLALRITDNGDQTATYTLSYEGEAWVAVAVSPSGQMVGAQAVIGLPDSGEAMIYDLNARSDAGVVVSDTQILTSSSVTQADGRTMLTFTVPLETDGFRVSSDGSTSYLYAYGTSNTLGFHAARSAFSAGLAGGVSLADDPTNYYKVHGILMALAWGVLCPLAIGASILRKQLFANNPGMFFQVHRALNTAVVLLTIVAFAVAIRATNIENLDHFTTDVSNHRALGLILFILAFFQACNGALRPGLPHKPENTPEDAPLPPKSSARKFWEVGHRVLGLSVLIAAWVNCTTGIEQYSMKFDAEQDKWTTVFWTIAGILAGIIVLSYAGVSYTKLSGETEDEDLKQKSSSSSSVEDKKIDADEQA